MTVRARTPLLEALLAELAEADEAAKRELVLRMGLQDQPERLLDARQKAEQLGLHPQTLERMARDGRIWAEKKGREWRFRADRSEIRPVTPARACEAPAPARRGRASVTVPGSVAAIRGDR